MNILFICTANRDRSRTAEVHFQFKFPEHRFRSAGINKYLSERHGGIHVKQYMLEVADLIICMEHVHSDYIVRQINKKYLSKIEIIELGDTESFMSPSLIQVLEEKTNRYFSVP
jgi:predicted protein tyrosine phosphatase